MRRVELAALQVAFQGFAQDAIPPLHRIQLLRSFSQPRQEAGDPQVGAACLVLVAMRAAECQRYLTGVLGLSNTRASGSQMSGKGYGSRDSVQAPLTLITAFGRLASSNTFGRSAQGCGGTGGTLGCRMPRWSMMNRVSGWRSMSAVPASTLPQNRTLTHQRRSHFVFWGEQALEGPGHLRVRAVLGHRRKDRLRPLHQCPFDAANVVVALACNLPVLLPAPHLAERELQQRQAARLVLTSSSSVSTRPGSKETLAISAGRRIAACSSCRFIGPRFST